MSNTCKYWDCGWCYALDNVETNADSQSACVNPSVCPYLVRDEAMRPATTHEDDQSIREGVDPYNLSGRDPMRSVWKDGKRPSPDYYEILNKKTDN